MFDHAPVSETRQFDANGRAAAIAHDLERAAAGIDTAFHAARAFRSLDHVAYSGPISAPSAERIMRALDGVRPRLLSIGDGPEHYIFILAALESARYRVNLWARPKSQTFPDKTGSVAADLVRWLAKSCDMACCFLEVTGRARFPVGAELPEINVRAVPIRKPRK